MSETPQVPEAEVPPQRPATPPAETGKVRKAPRLPLEFAVAVRYENAGGEMVRINCKTISVCVNGALLALPGGVRIGQSLQLTNVKTSQEVECIVRSMREEEEDKTALVGVEFTACLPEFWEILFPRDADDPPPAAAPEKPRPEKPFFGRAKTLPERRPAPEAPQPPPGTATELAEGTAAPGASGRQNVKTVGVLAIVLVAVVSWMLLRPAGDTVSDDAESGNASLPEDVARLVPNSTGYRLARPKDFAPEASTLLQALGQDAAGQISGKVGSGRWQAYALLGGDNSWRVCIVADGALRYDERYSSLLIAGRIPLSVASKVRWSVPPPQAPNSDGLLIVRADGKNKTAELLLVQGTEVVSGTLADYKGMPTLTGRY